MIIGRAIGSVVSTRKHDKLRARALLVVQPIDLDGRPDGDEIVAVDTVGAGAGELVLVVMEGKSTSAAMRTDRAPADAAIVGIVDHMTLDPGAWPSLAAATEERP